MIGQSLVFWGLEELTIRLPSFPQSEIQKRPTQVPFLVYSLSSLVSELAPPYDFDRYADFLCQSVLPDIKCLVADNGLLVILCHEHETIPIPLAVWNGFSQMVKHGVLFCIISDKSMDARRPFQMSTVATYQTSNFSAVAFGSHATERLANAIISFASKSTWGISLPLLTRELGE